MNETDDRRERAKLAAELADAERLAAQRPSALPADPSLPPDAQALRAAGITPLERLDLHAAGRDPYDGDMSRMAADKAMLPYLHRQPAARQEIAIDQREAGLMLARGYLAMLRSGEMTLDDARAMRDAGRSPADRSPPDAIH